LTLLAVALAATLLTALLTIAATARTRVLGQLTRGGPLAAIRVDGSGLDGAAVRRIEAVPDVASVLPVVVAEEVIVPPVPPYRGGPGEAGAASEPFVDGVVGLDLRRPGLLPVSVLAGRLPRAGSSTEVVVTETYLARVGLDRSNPVPVLGTQIQLGSARFLGAELDRGVWGRFTRATVVGVVAQEAGSGEVLAPVGLALAAQRFAAAGTAPTVDLAGASSGFGSVPGVDALSLLPAGGDEFAALLVEARDLDRVGPAMDRIRALGYSTSAPENLIATVQRYLHVLQMVLAAIGLIALGIAALGIANALFAAVRERRREIGVLKAIGARDADVLRVFLVEAALVGLGGGVLGAAAGWAVARAVAATVNAYLVRQGMLGVALVSPLGGLAAVVGGSTMLALAAGALPAVRASRLPAREAMGAA
jgi:FtsX-like permease family/MacB-like periplasmic core domain